MTPDQEQASQAIELRCGDLVRHHASEETWVVAYADYDSGYLAWSGWPEGRALIRDVSLVRAVSDDEHRRHVEEWLSSTGVDHRRKAVKRLYGTLGRG